MSFFKISINTEALAEIPESGIYNQQIIYFLNGLKTNPQNQGDYCEIADDNRTLFVKIIGPYAVTYWPDKINLVVRVIQVESADGHHPEV